MSERQFRGVWIDASIWLDKRLTLVEKALLAEVDSFAGNGKSFHKCNDTIQDEYGISRNTIARALRKLQELGFVEVSFNGRVRHVRIRAGSIPKMGRQSTQNGEAASPNDTSTNTKEITTNNTLKNKGVVMPWDSKEFGNAWQGYLEMRKAQHSFTYKSNASLQTALHKLHKMSNGNEATAIAIIAESIAWCWKGLFPLKQNKHEPTGTTDGSLIEAHLRNLSSKP